MHSQQRLFLNRTVVIQNEYSLLCRNFESDLSEIALSEDCGLLAWSPLIRAKWPSLLLISKSLLARP
jgi:aryl-alcohol dehydrogenase-like predicted oxidoreductase